MQHAAKISDYRFRKVLACFVRDHTATETARMTGLSVNSVNDLYRKIRIYFYDAGLFMNFYGGAGPARYDPDDHKDFERTLLRFHRNRLRSRRGVRETPGAPNYHLAESWWRFDFAMILRERPSDSVYDMMVAQLLAIIRVAGPIGRHPKNPAARSRVIARLVDQKILWFLRNAPGFANPELRAGLDEALHVELPEPDAD
ncbi:hypothetical protein [uncultured Bradyrhizobium sp.]|uniref:hypothetical protein n=1 Tax=uncultured Bradyrhizobium sp. TaxID=199684 RepID=UPI0035CBDD7F